MFVTVILLFTDLYMTRWPSSTCPMRRNGAARISTTPTRICFMWARASPRTQRASGVTWRCWPPAITPSSVGARSRFGERSSPVGSYMQREDSKSIRLKEFYCFKYVVSQWLQTSGKGKLVLSGTKRDTHSMSRYIKKLISWAYLLQK